MVPINQVILGGDPLLGSSMVGNSLDEQLRIETILEGMKMMVSWMCLILEAIGLVTGSETLA